MAHLEAETSSLEIKNRLCALASRKGFKSSRPEQVELSVDTETKVKLKGRIKLKTCIFDDSFPELKLCVLNFATLVPLLRYIL